MDIVAKKLDDKRSGMQGIKSKTSALILIQKIAR